MSFNKLEYDRKYHRERKPERDYEGERERWKKRQQKIYDARKLQKCLQCPTMFKPKFGKKFCTNKCYSYHNNKMKYKKRSEHNKATQSTYREIILSYFDYTCYICGHKSKELNDLEIHHKIPLSNGGRNHILNVVCICLRCHKDIHKNDRYNIRI